jgi:hypothetical protein
MTDAGIVATLPDPTLAPLKAEGTATHHPLDPESRKSTGRQVPLTPPSPPEAGEGRNNERIRPLSAFAKASSFAEATADKLADRPCILSLPMTNSGLGRPRRRRRGSNNINKAHWRASRQWHKEKKLPLSLTLPLPDDDIGTGKGGGVTRTKTVDFPRPLPYHFLRF